MHNWPLEGTGEGSEPTTREPAWESDTHTQLTQAQAWVVCPQVVRGPCQALWPAGALRKISDPPTPYFNSFTEDGAPLPQPCSCLSGQREGKWPEGEV